MVFRSWWRPSISGRINGLVKSPIKSGFWVAKKRKDNCKISQQCCWGFKSSGMWQCVCHRLRLTDVLKGCSAFSFKGEQSRKMSAPLYLPGWLILTEEGTIHPVTQCHIPQDLNSQSMAMVTAVFCNVISVSQSVFKMHSVTWQMPVFLLVFVYTTTHCSLKAYYVILVGCSNFRHQVSPRVSPHESTQWQKAELWARNVQ